MKLITPPASPTVQTVSLPPVVRDWWKSPATIVAGALLVAILALSVGAGLVPPWRASNDRASPRRTVRRDPNAPSRYATVANLPKMLGQPIGRIDEAWDGQVPVSSFAPTAAQREYGIRFSERAYECNGVLVTFFYAGENSPVEWAFLSAQHGHGYMSAKDLLKIVGVTAASGVKTERVEWTPASMAEGEKISDVAGIWVGLGTAGPHPRE